MQGELHTAEARDPVSFARALRSDERRRLFVLDGDVEEQTMELMVCPPNPDCSPLQAGMRRIDRSY